MPCRAASVSLPSADRSRNSTAVAACPRGVMVSLTTARHPSAAGLDRLPLPGCGATGNPVPARSPFAKHGQFETLDHDRAATAQSQGAVFVLDSVPAPVAGFDGEPVLWISN